MIAWSIEGVLKSGCFDCILVSTVDLEIANIAKAHGVGLPFFRSKELSDDHAGITPVIAHAAPWSSESVIFATQGVEMFQRGHFSTRLLDLKKAWHGAAQLFGGMPVSRWESVDQILYLCTLVFIKAGNSNIYVA
jgi:hypothetical protein